MKITLYSIGCPPCKTLESLLDKRDIDYELVTDEDIMNKKGFTKVPMLEVDGEIMNYSEAFKWINNSESILKDKGDK